VVVGEWSRSVGSLSSQNHRQEQDTGAGRQEDPHRGAGFSCSGSGGGRTGGPHPVFPRFRGWRRASRTPPARPSPRAPQGG
jgi:hypothetical protein